MYTVYCLVGERSGFVHVGLTSNPLVRLEAHNCGRVCATKRHATFRMIVLRHVATLEQARRSERYFKSGFGRKQLKRFLAAGETRAALPNPFAGD